MFKYGIPFMEVQSYLIIALPEQHYNNPKHTWQLCPHGPIPMKATLFCRGWGQSAKPPPPYKPLGLWAWPLPHRQES